jgi:hypothetical protein
MMASSSTPARPGYREHDGRATVARMINGFSTAVMRPLISVN